MLPGDPIFISNAGNLRGKVKKIFHAIGPRWIDGAHNEKNCLHEVVTECLEKVNLNRYESIALPLISGGAFRFPIVQCVETVIEAVYLFTTNTENPSLRRIYLVSIKKKEVDELNKQLQNKFNQPLSSASELKKGPEENYNTYKGQPMHNNI